MEKKSIHLFLLAVVGITTVLVIPMIGITAETGSVTKLQWECCSWENEEKENYYALSIIPIIGINHQ